MCMKTKANPHSHQKRVILVKKDLLFGVLAFKPKEEGESSGRLVPHVYNFEACKKALAEMIILDELSFRFVERLGFRRFMSVTQPRFHPIPCCITMAKACFRVFLDET